MKELTIKEKAKAYDEVVNKLKGFMAQGVDPLITRADVQDFFPELKESEDERIRKKLIEAVKRDMVVGGTKDKQLAIAWLEKQGTPAKLSEEEQNRFAKGVLTSCAMSFIDYLDAHKHEGKMCVSNGECEDIENAFHNAMWDKLHRYYGKYIEKQGEQILANTAKTCKDEPKPWSEEDKRNLNWVINVWNRLRRGGDAQTTPSQMEYLENFLKSLKYRYTWKPSDKQMNTLEYYMHTLVCNEHKEILFGLYTDLKKLREE